VHAQGMTIGGAIVSASHGLQSVSDTSNTTSNTLQFTNATTAFKATSNIELTSASKIIVESNVLMDFKTLGQIEFPGSTVEQEYPPGPMSGYETLIPGHGVFCASATAESNDGTYNSYEAFDGDLRDISAWQPKYPTGGDFGTNGIATTQTQFNPGGGAALVNGPALIIQFPHKVRITSYNVYARKASDVSYLYANKPKSGRVYGSNDGSTWTHVDTFGDWTSWTANTPQTETVTTPGAYNRYALVVETITYQSQTWAAVGEWKLFGTPGPTTLDKGSLTLGRSLDVPRVSRYDVDTETPRPEKLLVDFDTTVNSSPTDISGKGNHGTLVGATYSPADKAFSFDGGDYIQGSLTNSSNFTNTVSLWFKTDDQQSTLGSPGTTGNRRTIFEFGDIGNRSGLNHGFVDIRNTYMTIYMGDTGQLPSSAFAPQQNQWHHLVLIYSGSGTLRIFIDNTEYTSSLVSVVNGTLAVQVNADLLLGSEGRLNSAKFRGDISNFKVYSVALEPSEVQKLYRLGRTGRSMVISDTAVGIGKVPEAQLDVRGNLNVDGVIKSNGPVFSAYEYDGYTVTAVGYVTLGNTFVNKGGCYDTSNGIFTAPISGTYRFTVDATLRSPGGTSGSGSPGSGITTITLYINNVNWNPTSTGRPLIYQMIDPGTHHQHVSGSLVWNLNAGDTARIYMPAVQSGTDINWGEGYGRFMGYLIS